MCVFDKTSCSRLREETNAVSTKRTLNVYLKNSLSILEEENLKSAWLKNKRSAYLARTSFEVSKIKIQVNLKVT